MPKQIDFYPDGNKHMEYTFINATSIGVSKVWHNHGGLMYINTMKFESNGIMIDFNY